MISTSMTETCDSDSGSLEIFPEEVWEAILERVKCSKDVKNVFRAFLLLDKAFHNKKGEWLFGLILPHLMTKHLTMKMLKDIGGDRKWTQSKELLNLRLVSKGWKYTVDSLLQNEANQCPPPPSSAVQVTSVVAKTLPTGNHFNYLPMSEYHLGMTIFHNAEHVNRFMEDMLDHHGNPFSGKAVWIQPPNALVQNSEPLIEKCVDLFKKFGKHVDTLELEFFDRTSKCHLEMCKNILKCLFYLPNLRSLTFKGQFEGQCSSSKTSDVATSKYFENPKTQNLFPKLVKLESFSWQVVRMSASKESIWTIRMIKTYAKGEKLKGLGIETDLYWGTVLTSKLTNLTELTLILNDCFERNLVKLEKVLMTLPSGQKLRKLVLKTLSPWDTEVKVNLNELINILAGFQIDNLVLEDLPLVDELESEMSICKATAITSLVVEDNLGLSYEFLEYLPNLSYLTVHQSKKVRQDLHMEFNEGNVIDDTLARKLRKAILKPYDSEVGIADLADVWERFRKLKLIRGSVEFYLDVDVDRGERPGYNLGVEYLRECGNKACLGWLPKWDPDTEQWIEEGNDDDEDFWF